MNNDINLEEALLMTPAWINLKVIFDSGYYCSGRKKKVLRQLSNTQKNMCVFKMNNTMTPIHWKRNLVFQKIIYCHTDKFVTRGKISE